MILRIASAFAALTLAIGLSLSQGGTPAIAGPFTGLGGDWSGDGKLTSSSGSERLRCRASYSVGQDGDNLDLSIRCASDSYKFDLTGYMTNSNGTISGKWSEPNYNSAGTLSGRVSGTHISAVAIGNTFSARLSLTTGSNRMSVTIRPEATDIRQVSLSLRKR
jgi:hypothetical protein